MKNSIYFLAPAFMIFVGLQIFSNVVLTFILFYGWLLAIPLVQRRAEGSFLGWKWSPFYLGIGIGTGLLFFVFIFGGMYWLHPYFIDMEKLNLLLEEWGFSGRGVMGLILVLLVINPILEEMYWRGFMHERLNRICHEWQTILFTSFFYTLYHFLSVLPMFEYPLNIMAVLPVFIAGVLWGYIREWTGSIVGTVVSHILGDFGIMCVYWFIVR
ncbi:CPBP family intramembrane metalloprotease [Pontibacillus yanchengensis]|uniref:CPBP family intramembrane metalloprotease n=1 Tax=Pontibacillus yanchengensis TaxID=462910 RepID=A0ACC7VL97_9BACI|nr:type II CAAX endopeptidase family protein [Pontibacillus yanchengensis]MYL55562.1 CPBP family intramembrane metalloprotease [Pontibacillus yanchengensis]